MNSNWYDDLRQRIAQLEAAKAEQGRNACNLFDECRRLQCKLFDAESRLREVIAAGGAMAKRLSDDEHVPRIRLLLTAWLTAVEKVKNEQL